MSVSIENYLKAVYQLKRDEHQRAVSARLVERLGISGAAITDMAKQLAKKGLVEYKPYKEIRLTRRGEKKALAVIRRHRLWETFLVQVLNIPWEKVHDEAELLEHQTSEFLIDKIDAHLGYPRFDPHGDPIPNKEGRIMEREGEGLLAQMESAGKYTVTRLHHHDYDLMDFYNEHGVRPGKELHLLTGMDKFGTMTIEIEGQKISIPGKIADNVYVKPKKQLQ